MKGLLPTGMLLVLSLWSCSSTPPPVSVVGSTASLPAAATTNGRETPPLRTPDFVLSSGLEIQDFSSGEPGPYLIGAGDLLRLTSLTKDYGTEELRVAPDGTINVTTNGMVRVARKDIPAAEREINALLGQRFDNVEVKVALVATSNRKVVVLGDVGTPGVVNFDGDLTVAEALARAGGLARPSGDLQTSLDQLRVDCRIVRANGKSVWISLTKALFQGDSRQNLSLRSNDILYVYQHFE